jgi:hypothetical protein
MLQFYGIKISYMASTPKTEMAVSLARDQWGPKFWEILHTMAELTGNQVSQIENNDEADAWIILLRSQAFTMPCALCKQHYLEWQKNHPFSHLRKLLGKDRRDFLRKWLWGCHDRVNQMNMKKSPEVDELPALFPKRSIGQFIKEIYAMFQLALNQQQLKPEDITRWKQVVSRLRMMYGI